MANTTIYPYGTGGNIPSGVGIINDLTTGGVDKALSAQMGKEISDTLGDVAVSWDSIDLSSYTLQVCSLGQSGWYFQDRQSHIAIPVTPGEKYRVSVLSTDAGLSFYGWLTSSYSPPYSNGASIPYVSGTSRITVNVGGAVTVNVPASAAYLVLTITDGAGYSADWKVEINTGHTTVGERLEDLEAHAEEVDTILEGDIGQIFVGWGVGQLASTLPSRYYRVMSKVARAGDVINFRLNNYSAYNCAIAVTTSPVYGSGSVISGTGWKTSDINKEVTAAEDGYYIRAIIRKSNDGAITVEEGDAATTLLTTTREDTTGGLIDRVTDLENKTPPPALPFRNIGSTQYVGRKISFEDFSYTYTPIGTLSSGISSRQGGAIYGNYLFQFHNTLENIVVFRLDTAQNVQTLSLTAISYCHAGSGGFSGKFYSASDPFPLLYISSMDEAKIYVFRITGLEGAWSITLVQTITLLVDFYLPNVAVDAPNGRAVIFGYTQDSWASPSNNESIICCFDLPQIGQSAVTVSQFDNTFHLPFIYAQQGACAKWGKLYLSFGNTTEGLATGGIIVIDYTLMSVESYLDLAPLSESNFEPEALGIWNGGLVVTSQAGAVIKLVF